MQVLLIRNSGRPFLAHCRDAILAFLGAARRLAFVTAAALRDKAAYYMRWRALHSVPSGTWSTSAGTGILFRPWRGPKRNT